MCGGESRSALLKKPMAVLQGAIHGKGHKMSTQNSLHKKTVKFRPVFVVDCEK